MGAMGYGQLLGFRSLDSFPRPVPLSFVISLGFEAKMIGVHTSTMRAGMTTWAGFLCSGVPA